MKSANQLPTTAATLLTVFATVHVAQASIIYSGVQDVALPNTFNGVYLDFTDLNSASTFSQSSSEPLNWDLNFFFAGIGLANSDTFAPILGSATVNTAVMNLAPLTPIDGSSILYGDSSVSTDHLDTGGPIPQFNNGVEGYFGFLIEFSGAAHPGWARVTLNNDGSSGTLHDWAWESTSIASGGSILTGVPEASESLVVICGLTGLLLGSRRRKREATQA